MKKERKESGAILQNSRNTPWPLLFIFLFLTAAIAVSGYIYYHNQKKTAIRAQTNQLQAIADLKAANIQRWLKERLGDAGLIMESPMLTAELRAYLHDRFPGPRRESIRRWMASLRDNYHYQNVMLLAPSREAILTLDERYPAIGAEELDVLEAAWRRKNVVLSDLRRSAEVPFPHLDVFLPLLAEDTVAGFILLRIDPGDYLFPMIQSWPTPSPSAETLLVERQGDDVLFLNELRHRKDTAMKLRIPIHSAELPAALAVLGKTGPFSGRDYRGVPVWSVGRPITGTSWFILAKIDREEIEHPIRRNALTIFLVALFLVLTAALMLLFLWQRQSARFRLGLLEAENQKQALVKHFDYLTRYANDIILLTDEKWNILEANERAMLTYGYGREALLKMNMRDLRVPGERDQLAGQMRRTQEQLGLIFETAHQKKNGVVFPVEVSSRAIVANNKIFFQDIIRDISERKHAETMLKERERQISLIYDTVGDVIFNLKVEKDGNYYFTSVNQRFLATTGLQTEQIIGKRVQEVIPEPSLSLVLKKYAKAIRTKKLVRWEETSDYPTGRVVGEVSIDPALDDAGNCIALVGSVHDITERKRAEELIRQLNADLERRVTERTAQLEAANKELEAFSYSVSHDLRAPLRAIEGFSRIMLEEYAPKLDDEGRRLLDVITGNTRKMAQLIDDLLAFSRLSRQQMAYAPVDLAALTDDVFSELKSTEKGRRIEFKTGALPPAFGDRSMLRQVLQNLLSNAVKFTRNKPRARIEFGGQAAIGEVIYYVKDNGAGFDMEYAHKLFGVFQRLHGSDEFEGTGVGLAIVQRIVLRHGGRVWAESGKSGGATFYFALPTAAASETVAGEEKLAENEVET